MDRIRALVGDYDLAGGVVEIGPLCSPVVRRSEAPVRYVDHVDASDLREKYHDAQVRLDDICDVDIVWSGVGPLDLGGFSAGLCIASHIVEHIPDPIRWLNALSASLRSGGEISLAIPDKRYTFDVRRGESRPDELLAAYIEERSRPSPSQIIGHGLYFSHSTPQMLWNGELDSTPELDAERANWAFQLASDVHRSGRYLDVHCWVWTPASFCDAIAIAREAGALNLKLCHLEETAFGEFEFFARLRAAS